MTQADKLLLIALIFLAPHINKTVATFTGLCYLIVASLKGLGLI